MQTNYKTQTEYKGSNSSILQAIQIKKEYKSCKWMTFLQAKEMGYRVRKGEHGVRIMRFVDEKETGKKDKVAVRFYTVFNLEQIEKQD